VFRVLSAQALRGSNGQPIARQDDRLPEMIHTVTKVVKQPAKV
jgi:hypothetical protein